MPFPSISPKQFWARKKIFLILSKILIFFLSFISWWSSDLQTLDQKYCKKLLPNLIEAYILPKNWETSTDLFPYLFSDLNFKFFCGLHLDLGTRNCFYQTLFFSKHIIFCLLFDNIKKAITKIQNNPDFRKLLRPLSSWK